MLAATARLSPELQQRIRDRLQQAPAQMTLQLARDLDVPEAEIIRHMPDNRAVELDLTRWQALIEELPAFGSVHVLVSNSAATLEVQGEFGNFSTWGDFFNVQTSTLDLHLRHPNLGTIFAVEKPSHMTGVNTLSFQFYDRAGQSVMKVFLTFGNAPTPETQERFETLRECYRLPG